MIKVKEKVLANSRNGSTCTILLTEEEPFDKYMLHFEFPDNSYMEICDIEGFFEAEKVAMTMLKYENILIKSGF